jgi:hypothetical protein
MVARKPLEKALAKSKSFGPLDLSKSIAPLSRPFDCPILSERVKEALQRALFPVFLFCGFHGRNLSVAPGLNSGRVEQGLQFVDRNNHCDPTILLDSTRISCSDGQI